jgi:hypothetical protein
MKKILFIFIMGSFLPILTLAHPGRTDSSGCHTCRTNCAKWGLSTGEYHCHQAKITAPQPVAPIKSHKNDTGVGYTTPAPEYAVPKQEVKKIVIPKTTTKTTPENIKTPKCTSDAALSLDKKYCVKIPANAHAVNSKTDVWLCNDYYKEVGNSCIKIINNPKNNTPTTFTTTIEQNTSKKETKKQINF